NFHEAARLLGEQIQDRRSMKEAVRALAIKYRTNILLKGGHLIGDNAVDLLSLGDRIIEFSAPFMRNIATYGTGCTYSAAIAAGLALGLSLEAAVGRGKE